MKTTIQHPPIRKPRNWEGDNASLVYQIEQLFDDVYRRLSVLQDRVKALEVEPVTPEEPAESEESDG